MTTTHDQVHTADRHDTIHVRGARANNLRGVDLDLPKRRLVVVTGVSGSGKSSLVFGTIAAESRRLFDETYSAFIQSFMPNLPRPEVDALENLTPAIIIDQERMGANARSTVGTATDASSLLRLLYSRLSEPHVGPSGRFSFNLPEGMCPECEGIGTIAAVDVSEFLDESKSLNEGAIEAPNLKVGSWMWRSYAESEPIDPDKKIRDYTDEERHWLLYQEPVKVKFAGINVTYEGLVSRFRRSFLSAESEAKQAHIREFAERISSTQACPSCGGARLNEAARTALVGGRTIVECSAMQVDELLAFVRDLDAGAAGPARDRLADLLGALVEVGLGYLSLDRHAGTLSGGEAQRVKMVRHLGSPLTDVTYVFDEPTIGLHPHDIDRMIQLLERLRDKGNTVVVVEHKPEVILRADHVVDIGPGSGPDGGEVVFTGDVAGLRASETATGRLLERGLALRDSVRDATGTVRLDAVERNNVHGVSLDLPLGGLVAVTGVAGSGKSSLVHGGLAGRDDVLVVDQSGIRGSRRSNPATFTGMLDRIRQRFAKANGVPASLFSSNSDGACPNCKGLGVVYLDLAIMAGVATTCEECQGRRFQAEVLDYLDDGLSIDQVLDLTVAQAAERYTSGELGATVKRVLEVGLGYVRLGQPLTTLSGGERQRLKLAAKTSRQAPILVLDEPTSGLHLQDTGTIVAMLHRLVDAGQTVVVIEHNLAVVAEADWIVDIGPGAGHAGGTVVFEGTPHDLVANADTPTARHLRTAVGA